MIKKILFASVISLCVVALVCFLYFKKEDFYPEHSKENNNSVTQKINEKSIYSILFSPVEEGVNQSPHPQDSQSSSAQQNQKIEFQELTDFYKALGDDALGEKTVRAVKEYQSEFQSNGLQAQFRETALVKDWMQNPSQGLKEIQILIGRLSSSPEDEYVDFKTQLFSVAKDLPGQLPKVQEFAKTVIDQPLNTEAVSKGINDELYVSGALAYQSTAFKIVLKGLSAESALKATVEAMKKQTDPWVRATFMSNFLSLHPSVESDLMKELEAHGIEDPHKTISSQSEGSVEN